MTVLRSKQRSCNHMAYYKLRRSTIYIQLAKVRYTSYIVTHNVITLYAIIVITISSYVNVASEA